MIRFVHTVLVLSLLFVSPAFSQPLSLPPLPYAYDALEPVISEATMRAHHLSHHQTYTDKTNALLTQLRSNPQTKHLTKLGLDHLIRHIHNLTLPLTDAQRTQLRNNGGGYLNHAPLLRLTHSTTADRRRQWGGGGGGRGASGWVGSGRVDSGEFWVV